MVGVCSCTAQVIRSKAAVRVCGLTLRRKSNEHVGIVGFADDSQKTHSLRPSSVCFLTRSPGRASRNKQKCKCRNIGEHATKRVCLMAANNRNRKDECDAINRMVAVFVCLDRGVQIKADALPGPGLPAPSRRCLRR